MIMEPERADRLIRQLNEDIADLEARIRELEAERERLVAVAQFAQHGPGCDFEPGYYGSGNGLCTCGLSAALEQANVDKGE